MFFALLLGVSFFFIYKNNKFQRVLIFNAANETAGQVHAAYSETKEYLNMKRTNRFLMEENAALRAQLLSDKYKIYNRWLNTDTLYKQIFSYTPAQVINNSVDKANNYITLNVGSLHGVEPDMGIISPNGVVGVVKSVSPHFSVGLSLLHRKMQLSARLRNSDFFGSLTWQGTDENLLTLDYIPSYVNVREGDTVETTSYSSIFPQGLFIGTVKNIGLDSDEGYYRLGVKPATDFRRLTSAYVIKYSLKKEQAKLEKAVAEGDPK